MMRSSLVGESPTGEQGDVPDPARWGRRVLLLLLAACLGVGGGYIVWRLRSSRLPWASERGWRAHAIVSASAPAHGIERLWHPGCTDVSLNLRFEERADLDECLRLAEDFRTFGQRPRYFQAERVRRRLEEVLLRHPNCFYAEFLLGLWHRMQGNLDTAHYFLERSFAHAPVVLVQPFILVDGRPAAGAPISRYALKCIPVTQGRLQPGIELVYPALVTDEQGCIHIPAFGAVCRHTQLSPPRGYEVECRALGWFRSPAKVGLLPPAEVRPVANG